MAELCLVILVGSPGVAVGGRIVEVPVFVDLDVRVGRDHIMARRDLMDALVQGPRLVAALFDHLPEIVRIPACGHASGEQSLHFRCEIQRVVMNRIEQRLDAEPVACREHDAVGLVPDDEGELAAQPVQALRAEIAIEMQGDLAVRTRAEMMPRILQFLADRFVAVELAIGDEARAFVPAGDRLIAGRQVDDAEPGVAKAHRSVRADPVALPIGPAMMKPGRRPLDCFELNRLTTREDREYAAHRHMLHDAKGTES